MLTAPDGMNVHLYGPEEGRRADAALLVLSLIVSLLEAEFPGYVVYGDPAYPVCNCICGPWKSEKLDADKEAVNAAMSSVREVVEWGFKEVVNNFAFLDFRRSQRILHSPVGLQYQLGFLLTNCRTCVKGSNQISEYFGLPPPTLREYLQNGERA